MFLANKLNKGAGSPAALDAQFNYVTMLLHGDGTNGAQNNTFLDSSTNNFTITRNGNTTQGSFSPYGSNWSNYFDGSGDYLSIADNAAFEFGSGNFTIEGWINPSALPSGLSSIVTKSDGSGGAYAPYLIGRDGSSIIVRMSSTGSSWDIVLAGSFGTLTVGQWFHFALVRNGTAITGYLNGVGTSIATTSASLWDNSNALLVGGIFAGGGIVETWNGYISNVRLVKGTAVYTSNFTPPTAPLTAISGTSLLTCQSNRFKDNSTNNFTISSFGNSSVQRFNPFGASTAYSTSVIGGSGYFDGSGDYLTFSSNTPMDFGTGAFTIECWVYTGDKSISGGASRTIIGNSGNSYTMQLYIDTSVGKVVFGNTGSTNLQGTSGIANNAWHHIAVVRSGTGSNQTALFVDGAREALGTNSQNYTSGTIYLGAFGTSDGFWNGYVSNLRIVKGTAVYDPTVSTLTVPTAPLSAVTNTALLTSMTNGAIFDNAMMNDLETVGNAQISTSVKKYGTGSLAFDGTGDYLLGKNVVDLSFGTGDFTVECWAYWTATVADGGFVGSNSTGGMDFAYLGGTLRIGRVNTAWDSTFSWGTPTAGLWYHIAFTRSSGTARAFVNGTQVGSSLSNTNSYAPTGGVIIGASNGGDRNFKGYIDDLRITKGYARYTSNFTAPTAAFPNIGPV